MRFETIRLTLLLAVILLICYGCTTTEVRVINSEVRVEVSCNVGLP